MFKPAEFQTCPEAAVYSRTFVSCLDYGLVTRNMYGETTKDNLFFLYWYLGLCSILAVIS